MARRRSRAHGSPPGCGPSKRAERGHLSQVTGAGISILALLIGFSFSAAINRYDQRKSFEQEESSAISTEYTLAGLLPDADAAQLRGLLIEFAEQRIAFYKADESSELASIRAERARIEVQMWPIAERNAKTNQTAIMGQVVAGMDKVLSRPGYSLAAALDRIPDGTWTLMALLAVFCCALIGYSGHGRHSLVLRLVLPVFVSMAFFLIASLDMQRRGVIRVEPQNLMRVLQEMQAEK